MENTSDNQEKEKKTRVGRKKLVVTAIGVGAVLVAAGVAGTMYYRQTQSSTTQENGGLWGHQNGKNMNENLVTASGTTSIGVDAVTFAIDFLEDTSLYVEEVYVSSGDEVEAGTQYLKFTDDSIEEARSELETTAKEAEISYRSGVITTQESKIEAKYTYQQALLDAQQAQQVYEDALAAAQATLDAAEETYTEAQDDYNEYLYKVENNTFYEDYEVEEKKTAYEEAYDLYVNRVAYWELTEDELDSLDSSSSSMTGSSTTTVSTSTTASDSSATASGGQGDASAAGSMMGGGSSAASQEEQAAKADRQWILKTVALLEERMDEAEDEYEQAKEDYEDEIDGAELKLQKLLNTYESEREAYEAAQIAYQKEILSAKTTYETTLAKGQTAQNDYDTQLTSLSESLEKLADAKQEAEENLALFESLIGDGYLYTQEAGTILMSRAEEGETLAGGDIVFAYSNPEKITVSVAVSQDSIAQLSVGESAMVMISDYGNYNGVIESIDPVSSSDSRTSVTYTVEVALDGDVSDLSANLTATVIFGMDADNVQNDEAQQPRTEMEEEAQTQTEENTQQGGSRNE